MVVGGDGADNHLRIADVETGRELRTFPLRPHEWPNRFALSPDGRTLAAAIRTVTPPGLKIPHAVVLWNTATGKELNRLPSPAGQIKALALSPDGKTLLTVAGKDRTLHAWDLRSGKELVHPIRPNRLIATLDFSPDGTLLAFSTNENGRKSLFLWETAPWRQRHRLAANLRFSRTIEDVLAFSPDGSLLASVDYLRGLRFWDTTTGKATASSLPRPRGFVKGIQFSPDGKTLAVGLNNPTQGLTLWDVATGQRLFAVPAHRSRTRAMAFSPRRRGGPPLIATGGADDTVGLWDSATGAQRNLVRAHSAPVDAVALLPGGQALTVSHEEKTYRLWDSATARQVSKGALGGKWIAASLVAPTAGLLAVSSFQTLPGTFEKTIPLIDVRAGKVVRRLEGEAGMQAIAFTPDGRTLAAAQGSKQVVIWDAVAGKVLRRIELDREMDRYLSSPAAALSPDGKLLALRLAVVDRRPGGGRVVRSQHFSVWDVTTGKQRWSVPTALRETDSLAFSPDGKTLAQGLWGTIRLWDSATGKQVRRLTCHVPSETSFAASPGRLAFTPDGRTLIAGNGGARVFLWDLRSGKRRGQFVAHRGRVHAVSVAPDGKTFATASEDTTAMIWDLPR
jgi:WD40 repeat protein